MMTIEIYRLTATFPKDELFGLTSQIRRASTSIPANIAEGCGRDGKAELARFLQIASGSASELEYYLLLCKDIGLLKPDDYNNVVREVIEVKKMLSTFIKKLRAEC